MMHPYLQQMLGGRRQVFAESLEALGETIGLLRELSTTGQDRVWHAEGDVAAHTSMVIDEVEALLAGVADSLTTEEVLALRLGALLHDIGKPLVTRTRRTEDREQVIAPHHAARGASYLAYRLPELGLVPGVLFAVLALVRQHHQAAYLVRQDLPPRRFQALARRCDTRLLYWLCVADMRGRSCSDKQRQLDDIELFRLACEDGGAWGQDQLHGAFIDGICGPLAHRATVAQIERAVAEGIKDLEAGIIFTPEEAVARSYRFAGRRAEAGSPGPELLVTCGPSGSGKTSWIRRNLPDRELVSLDRLRQEVTGRGWDQRQNPRVFKAAREQLKQHLRAGRALVWDATCLRRDVRRAVLETGLAYGAHTTLVVFCPPASVIEDRNRGRRHPVPDSVLQRQLRSFEWPDLDEAHRTLFVDQRGDTIRDTRTWWTRQKGAAAAAPIHP